MVYHQPPTTTPNSMLGQSRNLGQMRNNSSGYNPYDSKNVTPTFKENFNDDKDESFYREDEK